MSANPQSFRPRLCFVGPMVGRNPGCVRSQGEILSACFENAGDQVVTTSSVLNRYLRLIDMARTLLKSRARIDVVVLEVYGHRSFVVEDTVSFIAKRLGLPVVLWLHGGGMPQFMSSFSRWTRRVFSRASAIVAPSEYLAESVRSLGFKAQVIPNIINFTDYPYRCRSKVKPRLFWMRSFDEVWNPLMAVRVLARLQSVESDAQLVMAGPDKGLQGKTRQLADQLGLNGSLRFPGFLDRQGKAIEGDAADIYINTNRIDNMPVAVVEACAMGLPIVTTAVGGIKYLLKHGETGLLVPDDDDEAMVKAIQRLIHEPQLAETLSVNGRKLALRSAWDSVRPQWERVFDEVTRSAGGQRL